MHLFKLNISKIALSDYESAMPLERKAKLIENL